MCARTNVTKAPAATFSLWPISAFKMFTLIIVHKIVKTDRNTIKIFTSQSLNNIKLNRSKIILKLINPNDPHNKTITATSLMIMRP